MREIRIGLLVLGLIMTGVTAKAQVSSSSRLSSKSRQSRNLPAQSSFSTRSHESRRSAIASPDILWVPCPTKATGLYAAVTCGYLPVPLDRRNPAGVQIKIYFQL